MPSSPLRHVSGPRAGRSPSPNARPPQPDRASGAWRLRRFLALRAPLQSKGELELVADQFDLAVAQVGVHRMELLLAVRYVVNVELQLPRLFIEGGQRVAVDHPAVAADAGDLVEAAGQQQDRQVLELLQDEHLRGDVHADPLLLAG